MSFAESREENLVDRQNAHKSLQQSETRIEIFEAPYLVGKASVDPTTNTIRTPAAVTHIEPRHMAVLAYLVRRAGQTVGRGELLNAGWGDRSVSDESLTESISRLRHAFGDCARSPSFIQTVPKKGYRLIAEVRMPEAPVELQVKSASFLPASLRRLSNMRPTEVGLAGLEGKHIASAAAALLIILWAGDSSLGPDAIWSAKILYGAAAFSDPNPDWLDIDPDF